LSTAKPRGLAIRLLTFPTAPRPTNPLQPAGQLSILDSTRNNHRTYAVTKLSVWRDIRAHLSRRLMGEHRLPCPFGPTPMGPGGSKC